MAAWAACPASQLSRAEQRGSCTALPSRTRPAHVPPSPLPACPCLLPSLSPAALRRSIRSPSASCSLCVVALHPPSQRIADRDKAAAGNMKAGALTRRGTPTMAAASRASVLPPLSTAAGDGAAQPCATQGSAGQQQPRLAYECSEGSAALTPSSTPPRPPPPPLLLHRLAASYHSRPSPSAAFVASDAPLLSSTRPRLLLRLAPHRPLSPHSPPLPSPQLPLVPSLPSPHPPLLAPPPPPHGAAARTAAQAAPLAVAVVAVLRRRRWASPPAAAPRLCTSALSARLSLLRLLPLL